MTVKAIATITLHAVVDVSATYRYYKLQSATLAAPSRPTAKLADPLKQAPSGWSIAEPGYSTGSTDKLYTVDLTVLSDDTFQYSNVSLSSSYEAAKEAWNKANNAQNTADSAKSYIDTITAQYGYQYKYDLTVYGDRTDYYYPVYFIGGNQNIPREIFIYRRYGEKAPNDWNTATHKGGLVLRIKANYGNWGGIAYRCELLDFSEMYSTMVGDVAVNKLDGYAMCVWLRGGGTTGAVYHVFSDQQIEYDVIGNWHAGTPIIATEGGVQIGWTGGTESKPTYKWVSDYPLTAPNTSSLDRLQAIKMANAAIKDVDVEYYLSTSATTLSGGSWSTTAPAWVDGKYMWSRTVTTDGAGNKTYSPSQNGVCIAGAKGSTGDKGDTGSAGKGVTSIVEQYYKSTSATSLSDGSWSDTYPGWENGKYIWTRSVITYTDNTTTTTAAVCVTGEKGSTGDKGDTGPRGIDVKSVTRYYYLSATAPTTPSTSWTTTEPTYDATADADKSLYYADYTTYSSGSPTWSAISKSSSYEAAKQAYSEAAAAAKKLASWCAKNNQTLIDGAKIYSGSITAEKISIDDIKALQAKIGGFTIGDTNLRNGTTSLAGADNSVYLGLDGISCGKTFKVDKAGNLNATAGKIGGFSIGTNHIANDATSLSELGADAIYIGLDGIATSQTLEITDLSDGSKEYVKYIAELSLGQLSSSLYRRYSGESAYSLLSKVSFDDGYIHIANADDEDSEECAVLHLSLNQMTYKPNDDPEGAYFNMSSDNGFMFKSPILFSGGKNVGTTDYPSGSHTLKNNTSVGFITSTGTRARGIALGTTDNLLFGKGDEGLTNGMYFYVGAKDSFCVYGGSNTDVRFRSFKSSDNSMYFQVPDIYARTTSSGSNVRVNSNGTLYRYSSSSMRYKTDITTKLSDELDPERLYDLKVWQYKYREGHLDKNDQRYGQDIIGFIAEDIKQKYPIAANYNEYGEVENWNVEMIVPAMLKLIQDQKKDIDELKEKLK